MGTKARDSRPPWQRRRAAADAQIVTEAILEWPHHTDRYGMPYPAISVVTGLSRQRVELAILRVQRTTGAIEYASPATFRLKRPCSSVAERVLGKDEVVSSTLTGGSNG